MGRDGIIEYLEKENELLKEEIKHLVEKYEGDKKKMRWVALSLLIYIALIYIILIF